MNFNQVESHSETAEMGFPALLQGLVGSVLCLCIMRSV